MGYIKKEVLWSLFRSYIIRKEKESNVPVVYHSSGYRCGGIDTQGTYTGFKGTIYFYEWSDVNRTPITFYSLNAFDDFLKRSMIFMPPFQKDMIRNLNHAYVTCKSGRKELVIRATRPGLLEAMGRADAPSVSVNDLPKGETNDASEIARGILGLPYQVACTFPPNNDRKPPMYNYDGYPEKWIG